MKQLFATLALLFLSSTLLAAFPGAIDLGDYIKDPNAKDMSPYIQAAVSAAANCGKALFVPGGRTYNMENTVDIASVSEIFSFGIAVFQMNNPEKDIFFSKFCHRAYYHGLTFKGGRDQLSIGNHNIDRSHISIEHCRFIEANGVAIRTSKESASTLVVISNCTFDCCKQTLVACTDHTHLMDSWIQTAKSNPENLPVIENWDYLLCTDIVGVPLGGGTDLRWIDNYGNTLHCRNFRFGGESGGGFTPVVNHIKYRKSDFDYHIVIEDSSISAMGNPARACAVYCEEIPNNITIRNCQVLGVEPIKIRKDINLDTYFKDAKPNMIRLDVFGNTGEFSQNLPPKLMDAVANVKNNKSNSFDGIQLSDADTKKALAKAVAEAEKIPRPASSEMKNRNGELVHKQKTATGDFISLAMNKCKWTLDDCLDGQTEHCRDYLAAAPVGEESVLLMARFDSPSYPHIRLEDVEVDLDKTPFLTWNLRNTPAEGGHIAVKVTEKSSGRQILLIEDYQDSMFKYFAYDLREQLKIPSGKIKVDIKFYLCGVRITAQGAVGKDGKKDLKQGEYFVIDFMRLESK